MMIVFETYRNDSGSLPIRIRDSFSFDYICISITQQLQSSRNDIRLLKGRVPLPYYDRSRIHNVETKDKP